MHPQVQRECACPGKTLWTIGPFGEFELDQQYVPLRAIGKGGSGVVCSATNMLTGEKVAIKKIGERYDGNALCCDWDSCNPTVYTPWAIVTE